MKITNAEQDIQEILFTEKQIAARVEALGMELCAEFGDKHPVMVCVLKGASYFYIDLCRQMNCHIDMDFIAVSSYGAHAKSTGVVRLIKDLDNNITGRHVILVEDIVDSGLTLAYLKELFGARKPASVTTVSFLDKTGQHAKELCADHSGFSIPDDFVVGYGLDYANYYRNLPYIGIIKPECYK
ncbi:MAG: hypoxanthine phosphoribosyltransferase [Eubacteriales bacterium]